MSRPQLVLLVTDQIRNHRVLKAFVTHEARRVHEAAVVTHAHVPKAKTLNQHSSAPLADLIKKKQPVRVTPILIFVDSECRDEEGLQTARAAMQAREAELRETWPNLRIFVCNPFSDAVYLLFDDGVAALRERVDLPQRFVDDKRRDRFIHKDQLDSAMDLDAQKGALDTDMVAHLRVCWNSTERAYLAVADQVRAALLAGLR